jgi:hypothetical protein
LLEQPLVQLRQGDVRDLPNLRGELGDLLDLRTAGANSVD